MELLKKVSLGDASAQRAPSSKAGRTKSGVIEDAAIAQLVAACVTDDVGTLVTFVEDGRACRGRFSSQTERFVVVDLIGEGAADLERSAQPLALVSLVFHRRLAHSCVTNVIRCELRDGALRLWLRPPPIITSVEARVVFRVPAVPGDDDVTAWLRLDTVAPIAGRVVDVSYTGALVEVRDEAPTALDLPLVGTLSVTLGQKTLDIGCVARRRVGNAIGVFFPETMKDDDVEPPSAVIEIVRELARRVLEARKGP